MQVQIRGGKDKKLNCRFNSSLLVGLDLFSMFFLLQQSSPASVSTNEESNAKIGSLSEEVTKLTEEKNTLQDRVKKANEENLNLIDKVHVSPA